MRAPASPRTFRTPKPHRGPIFCAAALLAACFGLTAAKAAPAVQVEHPWFRFLMPSLPAGGYMTLHNPAAHRVVLTGARTAACGMTMLHKTVRSGSQEKMVQVKSVVIPAHGSFAFRPGSYHVMCMQPKMQPGETVPVTLQFDGAAPVTVPFHVYGATGRPASR